MEFLNKTVLVTGASTGIGRATALAFAKEGAKVYANYLEYDEHVSSLEKLAGDTRLSLSVIQGDVSKADSVKKMFANIFSDEDVIDVLVNNAGVSMVKPFLDLQEADWDFVMNTDLKSIFLCSQAVIPNMLQQKSGNIVNVTSELGFSGRANFAAYTAAKGGAITLTRSMAREFAPNIRINAVAPGPTSTPLLEREQAIPGHEESKDDIPLARYATPEEIAESILFLASSKATYFCGEILSPNGGAVMC